MDLNALSGLGGFAEGLAGGLNQGLNRAESAKAREEANSLRQYLAQMQTEREMGKIQTKENVQSIDGAEANKLASGVAGKPVNLFTPGVQYHRSQVDSIVGNLKPSAQKVAGAGGSSRFMGNLSPRVKNMLASVDRAQPAHQGAVDAFMAWSAINPQSPMMGVAQQWLSSHPASRVMLEQAGGDSGKLAAMYDAYASQATEEIPGLTGSAREFTPEQLQDKKHQLYPALGETTENAMAAFNNTANSYIFNPYKAAIREMEQDRKPDGTWLSPISENKFRFYTNQLNDVQQKMHIGGTPDISAPGEAALPTLTKNVPANTGSFGSLVGKMLSPGNKPTPSPVTSPAPVTGGGAFGKKNLGDIFK